MKLLITRPKHQADTTVSGLTETGHDCLLEPLLEVVPLDTEPPAIQSTGQYWRGLMVTSSNAIPAISGKFAPEIPILTTGEATKTGLENAGFTNVASANGSALDLAANVPQWMAAQRLHGETDLLYPSAVDTAHDLVSILAKKNIQCTAWPVYETREKSEFSKPAKKALAENSLDGVLLYSPRTARCFNRLLENLPEVEHSFDLFVLSSAVANELNSRLQQKTHIAPEPNEASLFKLINRDPT